MSIKYKKVYATLNYIKRFLILPSTIIGCISIYAFASLVGIPIGITSCAIGLKICTIAVGIKKYKSIIMEKKKKHDKKSVVSQIYIKPYRSIHFQVFNWFKY